MESKKTGLVIATLSIVLFAIVTFVFLYKPVKNKISSSKGDVWAEYSDLQNQFALDLACGVTDFDSPYVKPVQCDSEKMQKGVPIKLKIGGAIYDENENPVNNVEISVNNSEKFYSDENGNFRQEIEIDSNKKAINLVATKKGYSPIRKVFNAEVPNREKNTIRLPEEFNAGFTMREVEVQNVALDAQEDTVIVSRKYPNISVTIPAGGLENSRGEIVTENITGEVTYLDPKNPEDAAFTPGFEGNIKQMIGVTHNGKSAVLDSKGMVFFHLKQEGSNEILQPRKGTLITITQPIPEHEYETMTNPEAVAAAQITEEELVEWKALYESFGITEDMDEDEKYDILVKNDQIAIAYWYFNDRTGLWEEWPVRGFDIDLERKVYILEVPRLY